MCTIFDFTPVKLIHFEGRKIEKKFFFCNFTQFFFSNFRAKMTPGWCGLRSSVREIDMRVQSDNVVHGRARRCAVEQKKRMAQIERKCQRGTKSKRAGKAGRNGVAQKTPRCKRTCQPIIKICATTPRPSHRLARLSACFPRAQTPIVHTR